MTNTNIPDDLGDFIEITVTRDLDGTATVAFMDTQPGLGRLRIRLNDSTIWNGDPDSHAHTPCSCSMEHTEIGAS